MGAMPQELVTQSACAGDADHHTLQRVLQLTLDLQEGRDMAASDKFLLFWQLG
jgi:hypothetical protein